MTLRRHPRRLGWPIPTRSVIYERRPPCWVPKAATKVTKVLLVDDDDLVLDQLERVVTAAGYEVVTARNGDAALLSMQQEFAPIVIADIDMPQMDGLAPCAVPFDANPTSGYVYVMLLSSKDAEGRHSHGPGRRCGRLCEQAHPDNSARGSAAHSAAYLGA